MDCLSQKLPGPAGEDRSRAAKARHDMRWIWLLLLLIVPVRAEVPEPTLKVGLTGSPPFVMYVDGKPTGTDVRMWEDVASQLKLKYEYRSYLHLDQALDLLAKGELDLVIGGIIITADRERIVDFTQPYYRTGSAILSSSKATPWDHFYPIVKRVFGYGVMALFGCLLLVGVLLWLAEHRVNHLQFSSSPARGIATGIWLALVTMSTVGYGDRVPVTLPGRIVAGVWMLISMLFVSSLVAGIASSITVSQIGTGRLEKAEQLDGLRIATVRGTLYGEMVRRYTDRLVICETLDLAIAAVTEGRADCVVFDKPSLRYFLARFPDLPLHLSDIPFEPQNFGWALPTRSPYAEQINVALLDEIESGRQAAIEREFMSPAREERQELRMPSQ